MATGRSVASVYDRFAKLEAAVERLRGAGFPVGQISVVARNLESGTQIHGFGTPGELAGKSAGIGAWTGGLFGILVGVALFFIPGIGPMFVLGPLAVALIAGIEGALAGVAAGGLLGALAGWGMSLEHIRRYEEHVKSGKYLLIAHGSDEEVEQARSLLAGTGAEEITVHRSEAPAPSRPRD